MEEKKETEKKKKRKKRDGARGKKRKEKKIKSRDRVDRRIKICEREGEVLVSIVCFVPTYSQTLKKEEGFDDQTKT